MHRLSWIVPMSDLSEHSWSSQPLSASLGCLQSSSFHSKTLTGILTPRFNVCATTILGSTQSSTAWGMRFSERSPKDSSLAGAGNEVQGYCLILTPVQTRQWSNGCYWRKGAIVLNANRASIHFAKRRTETCLQDKRSLTVAGTLPMCYLERRPTT